MLNTRGTVGRFSKRPLERADSTRARARWLAGGCGEAGLCPGLGVARKWGDSMNGCLNKSHPGGATSVRLTLVKQPLLLVWTGGCLAIFVVWTMFLFCLRADVIMVLVLLDPSHRRVALADGGVP